MEQRMLIVVFNGNELPDKSIVDIHNIIAKTAFAHPDDVMIHTINEEQLAKLVAKQIINEHSNSKPSREMLGDRTIKALAKKYDMNNKMSVIIQLTSDLAGIYERTKHGKNIQSDNDFVNLLNSLIRHKHYHSETATRYGYDDEISNIISKIYYKFFDENGNLAKR